MLSLCGSEQGAYPSMEAFSTAPWGTRAGVPHSARKLGVSLQVIRVQLFPDPADQRPPSHAPQANPPQPPTQAALPGGTSTCRQAGRTIRLLHSPPLAGIRPATLRAAKRRPKAKNTSPLL